MSECYVRRLCRCCVNITRADARHHREPREARYLWVSAVTANRVHLCVECCAHWRINAEADPELRPSEIHEIDDGWQPLGTVNDAGPGGPLFQFGSP